MGQTHCLRHKLVRTWHWRTYRTKQSHVCMAMDQSQNNKTCITLEKKKLSLETHPFLHKWPNCKRCYKVGDWKYGLLKNQAWIHCNSTALTFTLLSMISTQRQKQLPSVTPQDKLQKKIPKLFLPGRQNWMLHFPHGCQREKNLERKMERGREERKDTGKLAGKLIHPLKGKFIRT